MLTLNPISPTDLHWDTTKGGVDFSYTVSGGDLPADSTVDFYWATGPSTSDEIGGAVLTASVADAPGTYGPLYESAAGLGPAPDGAKYLLAVPDVGGQEDDTDAVSVAYDPFSVDSATTAVTSLPSQDITFTYDVNEDAPSDDQPLTFGLYRSSSSSFDPTTAILVNTVTEDADGNDFSEDLGQHAVTVNDPDALLPDPLHEYVYVVADPQHTIGDPDGTFHEAHYRKFVLGVVAHGFELFGEFTGVPDWETQMADDLVSIDGFDQAIPFDWASDSDKGDPGFATGAGDRLAAQIISAEDSLIQDYGQPGDVVDLDLIGHSRGAVVISQALQDLYHTAGPGLAGGYVKMTLLDPHPANNDEGLASVNGTFGSLVAGPYLAIFQAAAQDPQVVIPPNVDAWDDIYQNTPSSSAFGMSLSGENFMNLWGDDPTLIDNESGVPPTIDENLTNQVLPSGALIGHTEVPLWYEAIDVQLRLIFPGYPLPGGDAAGEAMEGTAAVIQNSVPSSVPANSTPSQAVNTQTDPAPGTLSGPPTESKEQTTASSSISPTTIVGSPVPSTSPSRPAQASPQAAQTQAILVRSLSPSPLPKPSLDPSLDLQTVPIAAQGHGNPVISPSVASMKTPQTQANVVRSSSPPPLPKPTPAPQIAVYAFATPSTKKTS